LGDGRPHDFDAARLTMELSNAGGGGANYRGTGLASGFDFEPPKNFKSDDYVYSGEPWNTLRIAADEPKKRLSAVQRFYNRGKVTVFSKTTELLAKLAAAVRTVMPPLRDEAPSAVIRVMKRVGQAAFTEAMETNPALRAREQNAAEMVIEIEGQTEKQIFVLRFDFDGNGILLVADLHGEATQ
jgi:hypothetical protein